MKTLLIKLVYAAITISLLGISTTNLQTTRQGLITRYEGLFQKINEIRRNNFKKNSQFKAEYNGSRYNLIENPHYCQQSDALKLIHPDILSEDYYIWRDYTKINLQKEIVLKKSFAVLPYMETYKNPVVKYENKLPLQLSFIYTSVSTLFNNYHWMQSMGCTFQKYNHIPGKGAVAAKNLLIENFMKSIDDLRKKNVTNPQCYKNASFIPETLRLSEKKDCIQFFESLKTKEYNEKFKKYGPQYILKTNQHRGQGITVLFEDEQRNVTAEYEDGAKCGQNTQQVIAQRYITNPFLYKGHKIEFRIYFSIVSTSPMIAYSYQRALIKRCAEPYDVKSSSKAAHVCNTAIVKDKLEKDKDHDIEDEEFFIDWYLEGLEELLIKQNKAKPGWLKDYLYPKIYVALIHMTRSTQHAFARDSSFMEFFAVDFLLDDDLDVWVLEVNYNPQVLSVTPDRIKRNYKMIEDNFDLYFAYLRSKQQRVSKFLRKHKDVKAIQNAQYELLRILDDSLEEEYQLSPENLYVKIMDEGLDGTKKYGDLIQKECL